MENNLPQGWVITPPFEIAEKIRGVSYDKREISFEPLNGLVPVMRANNIEDNNIFYKDLVYVPEKSISGNQLLHEGDVVIAMSSGSKNLVGKTAQYYGDKKISFGAFCGVLRPSKVINSKYFGYYFQSKEYRNIISDLSAGTNINNLKNEHFEALQIPIAPLAEQHRIVAKLDAVMQKVESNKQRLEKIPKLLKRFRQSVLAAAVSGKLTEEWRENKEYDVETDLPMNWQLVKIDKLINSTKTDLRTGPFGTSLKKNEHQPVGIPVWGIESIGENGSFTGYNKIFVTKEKAKELKSFEVKGGNIIISRSGTVGEICILPEDVQYGLISTNLMKIVLNNKTIHSKYFCWLFDGSQIVIDKLRELCTGSTRLFLTQTILKEIDYPLPPFDEQRVIINRVNDLFAFADKLEARYTKAKAMLDKLPQSILAKAFRGELVAQDPNDEPASVLLERIKKEKEKLNGEKKKTKAYSIKDNPLQIAAEGKVKYKKAT